MSDSYVTPEECNQLEIIYCCLCNKEAFNKLSTEEKATKATLANFVRSRASFLTKYMDGMLDAFTADQDDKRNPTSSGETEGTVPTGEEPPEPAGEP
jgi:hypothetical protein